MPPESLNAILGNRMYKNLKSFIDALEIAGELSRITSPTDPILEISKITDRESKKPRGGKALYFTNVRGSQFPVATNLFGSPHRIRMAMNVDCLDDLGRKVQRYTEFTPPRSIKDALRLLPMAKDVIRFFPRRYRGLRPPCQAVVYKGNDVDLNLLPVLQCWPKDAGRFITLPLVFTKSLTTGKRNVGMYRMQIYDRNTTGMHWHIHKDGAHFYNEYAREGRRMPVAVAIGADPATVYSATAPLPQGLDEMMLSGFIRNQPVRLTRCLTNDLLVPAEAEFVLEGYVEPGELRREGPFGDHTGYYSLADDYPVFHITAVTHRKNPIYQTTLVGPPPMEDCYLALATERLFLPMLQTVMPEIKDYHFPWEGVFHNIAIVSIKKAFAGHAHKVINGLWGQGQMSFCKTIVVVDRDISPQNTESVAKRLVNGLDAESDFTFSTGVLDVLDHSSPYPNFGQKLGIDLTTRVSGEPPRNERTWKPYQPLLRQAAANIRSKVDGIVDLKELAVGRSDEKKHCWRIITMSVRYAEGRAGKKLVKAVSSQELLQQGDIALLFDDPVDLTNTSALLWRLFNNVDPGRDLYIRDHRIVVNACRKRPIDDHHREWPEALTFDTNLSK